MGWTGPAARTPAESPQPPNALWRARRRSSGEQDSTRRASSLSQAALIEISGLLLVGVREVDQERRYADPDIALSFRRCAHFE